MSDTHFMPIPSNPHTLRALKKHWLPFVPVYAKRTKESEDALFDAVFSGRVQLGVIWNEKKEKTEAIIGVQIRPRGKDKLGEITIAAGFGVKDWERLLSEVETYLKSIGCTHVVPHCRQGWSRFLRKRGYKTTHIQMERQL